MNLTSLIDHFFPNSKQMYLWHPGHVEIQFQMESGFVATLKLDHSLTGEEIKGQVFALRLEMNEYIKNNKHKHLH